MANKIQTRRSVLPLASLYTVSSRFFISSSPFFSILLHDLSAVRLAARPSTQMLSYQRLLSEVLTKLYLGSQQRSCKVATR
jgi:hypothetical protein